MIGYTTILKSRIPEIIAVGDAKVAEALAVTANNILYTCVALSRVDTGNMRAGWETQQQSKFSHIVFNNVHYTIYNEYGTVHMAPQPMLGPAIEQELPLLLQRVRAAYG